MAALSIFNYNFTPQIIVLNSISTAIVILIGLTQPMNPKSRNKTEIFNEICVIIVIYHCICFTDFLPDANFRYNVGYSCCLCLIFNIIGNVSYLLRD